MALTSKYAEVIIPKLDFFRFSSDMLKHRMDEICVIDASSERQLTYGEIHNASIRLASAFTKRGLKRQEIVALSASNCIEYSLVVLGIAACNAITTTCNPKYTLVETQIQFENCNPKFIVTDSNQVEKMLQIAKNIPSIQEIFSVDSSSKCLTIWNLVDEDDGKDFPFSTVINPQDDVVLLPYSSGTTGIPKGVMLTHSNVVACLTIIRGIGLLPPGAVVYSSLPMFHIYGLMIWFNSFRGCRLIFDKRFHLKSFFEAVEKYKINYLRAVPAILLEISTSPIAKNYDLSSLYSIRSSGAPLATKLAITTAVKMQSTIVQSWGLTEIAPATSVSLSNAPSNSVGFVAPNTWLKVVDPETRQQIGPNENGELLLKGPQLMKGYFRNPKANATVFEEGWFCTGDIGHYDDAGFVYIVDRIKELIKYKGFQIAPAELENLLLTNSKVLDVGVTGVPDVEAGEVPRAFVVKNDQSLTEQQLHDFIADKVSKYKYLRGGIYFIDKIPRNQTGKILRRNLAKLPVQNKSKL